jgi:hypothetical protein
MTINYEEVLHNNTPKLYKKKIRYNHAYDIAFSLKSDCQQGNDVTPDMVRLALQKRIASMCDNELMEAVGAPFDTYEIEDKLNEAT